MNAVNSAERLPAPASAVHVRVLHGETAALEALQVFEDRALQHGPALLVHADLGPVLFNYQVVGFGFLLEPQAVREPRATARHDFHAQQPALLVLLLGEFQDFFRGVGGYFQHALGLGLAFLRGSVADAGTRAIDMMT